MHNREIRYYQCIQKVLLLFMLNILSITTPIYLIILIGYLLTRIGLFAKTDMRVLGKFVINLALPALLFRALSQRQISEIFNLHYLLAYGLGSWAAVGLGYWWTRRISDRSSSTSIFHAMGVSCSNSGFIGYPILLLTLAPVAGVALALNMVVENLLVIPFLLFLMEQDRGGSDPWKACGQALSRLARNPLIIGMLTGISVSLFDIHIPPPITHTIDMLANASSALSLIVIGGILVGLPMRGTGAQVIPIVIGKLIMHPLLVFLMLLLLPILGFTPMKPSLRMAAVLLAAMPMMSIYPTLAQAYGKEDFSAVALLMTTASSFFTLSGLLWIMHNFVPSLFSTP